MKTHKDLIVWQKSMCLVVEIYKLVKLLPKEETYALSDQMRRSAVSIPSNIAEGCSRRSQNEFAHFLEISLGSSYEVETQMEIARRLKYVTQDEHKGIINEVQTIEKKLTNLINSIRPVNG